MKNEMLEAAAIGFSVVFSLLASGCLGDGESEDSDAGFEIDCGEHGSAHGDHCHCYEGYLFDGQTCVEPDQITQTCGELDGGESKSACVCPETGTCPCDGEIEEWGGKKYCVPDLE
jgi:hypothetical protein